MTNIVVDSPINYLIHRNMKTSTIDIEKLQNYPSFIYVYHNSFDDPKSTDEIISTMPDEDEFQEKRKKLKPPAGVPVEFAPAYRYPLLTKQQEQHLFRRMNYYKHIANKFQSKLNTHCHRIGERFEKVRHQALAEQELLFGCNYRLMLSFAKKHAKSDQDLFDRISIYSTSLLTSLNRFDFSRGFKFSTYACIGINNAYLNYIRGKREILTKNDVDNQLELQHAPEIDQDTNIVSEQIDKLLATTLNQRELLILRLRAGYESSPSGSTIKWKLDEISAKIGVTKERVRQIEKIAINKLRQVTNPLSFGY